MPPARPGICDYLGFLLVSYCATQMENSARLQKRTSENFVTELQWNYINFTWKTLEDYTDGILNHQYIPENNFISGIKMYKDRIYLTLPRLRPGTPVTLAYINTNSKAKDNNLLHPFPSWNMNVRNNCGTLQNVQSIEIDRRGIMWVLDGIRINSLTSCSPKLVLLDLNQAGKVIHSYTFRNEIGLRFGGFLNDLVVDESDGGYAYITDCSAMDPGIVVYSRQQGRAWKLRDKTMFSEVEASNITVGNINVVGYIGLNAIALSPLPKNRDEERLVYYTALNGFNLYAINSRILRNEAFCRTDQWRRYVKYVGQKSAQSDGMLIDNKGNMFFGLLPSYSVSKWNIFEPFYTTKQFDYNSNELVWPDSFCMDSSGNLYVLTNGMVRYLDTNYPLTLTNDVKFRIMKTYIGNKNYMFTGK